MSVRALFVAFLCLALAACATTPQVSDKRIAITFDDTPRGAGAFLDPKERAGILRKALKNAGVTQAAFFANPGRLANRPYGDEHIRAYAADGHVIANHTATHPGLSGVSVAAYIADIDAAARYLKDIPNTRPWFRYPFLDEGRNDKAKRNAVRAALAKRGLINAYVTVDASDWFYENQARIAVRDGLKIDRGALRDLYVESHVEAAEFNHGLAIRTVGYSPAHVMLLHETDLAALYLVDLVKALKAKGWTIITCDEAYSDPFAKFATTYDTPSAQGTLTEQVAWERGLPAPRWYARNDTRLALVEFRRRVLGIEDESESASEGTQ